jgi:hypothetical protein
VRYPAGFTGLTLPAAEGGENGYAVTLVELRIFWCPQYLSHALMPWDNGITNGRVFPPKQNHIRAAYPDNASPYLHLVGRWHRVFYLFQGEIIRASKNDRSHRIVPFMIIVNQVRIVGKAFFPVAKRPAPERPCIIKAPSGVSSRSFRSIPAPLAGSCTRHQR